MAQQQTEALKKIAAEFDYVDYVPLVDQLTATGVSLPIFKNKLLYKDSNHLNSSGSKMLAEHYLQHKGGALN